MFEVENQIEWVFLNEYKVHVAFRKPSRPEMLRYAGIID